MRHIILKMTINPDRKSMNFVQSHLISPIRHNWRCFGSDISDQSRVMWGAFANYFLVIEVMPHNIYRTFDEFPGSYMATLKLSRKGRGSKLSQRRQVLSSAVHFLTCHGICLRHPNDPRCLSTVAMQRLQTLVYFETFSWLFQHHWGTDDGQIIFQMYRPDGLDNCEFVSSNIGCLFKPILICEVICQTCNGRKL